MKALIAAACGLLLIFFAGRWLGSCGPSKPSKATIQADSLEATRADFLRRQRMSDSILIVQTRRADSITLEAKALRRVADATGKRADSLAALGNWHDAYLDRTAEVGKLRASILTDSLAKIEHQKGDSAIAVSHLELRQRWWIAETETIPGLRADIDRANARAASQRWAGRLEGFSTGTLLGLAGGVIIGKAVSSK
jgi:hypothetical protein